MQPVTGKAHARAGLLGNPSDVYNGKTIAFIIRNFTASVTIEPSDHFEIVRAPADELSFPHFAGVVAALREQGCYGGVRLIRAAIKRFADHWPGWSSLPESDPRLKFKMSYTTDIPRQAGMSGSSAIVIAAIRALMKWFDVEIHPATLAELALAAELEDLGITAGPMDRVVQAYEGVVHMDFSKPRGPDSYTRLDPKILPPLFIAWDPRTGQASNKVHNDVRFRWLRGDEDVRKAMAIFPGLVDEGMECLKRGDRKRFMELVDKNWDTRASIWTLSERDIELVKIGRAQGAAVKFCGSGGAVVGVMSDESLFPAIEKAYTAKGYRAARPQIEESNSEGSGR
jgi:glucuronokinase